MLSQRMLPTMLRGPCALVLIATIARSPMGLGVSAVFPSASAVKRRQTA